MASSACPFRLGRRGFHLFLHGRHFHRLHLWLRLLGFFYGHGALFCCRRLLLLGLDPFLAVTARQREANHTHCEANCADYLTTLLCLHLYQIVC